MEFSRQEYWSGLSFPFPGTLPDRGIELESPALAGGFFTTDISGKPSHPVPLSEQRHPSGSSIYTHTNISWRTPEHLPGLHSREITLNGICPLRTSAAHTTLRKNPDLVPVWDMELSYRLAVNLQTSHTSRENGQLHWVHGPWPVTQPSVPCLLCAVGVCHLVGAEAHVHKAVSPQLYSRSSFCPCASSPWLKGHWIQKEENHKAECSPR